MGAQNRGSNQSPVGESDGNIFINRRENPKVNFDVEAKSCPSQSVSLDFEPLIHSPWPPLTKP